MYQSDSGVFSNCWHSQVQGSWCIELHLLVIRSQNGNTLICPSSIINISFDQTHYLTTYARVSDLMSKTRWGKYKCKLTLLRLKEMWYWILQKLFKNVVYAEWVSESQLVWKHCVYRLMIIRFIQILHQFIQNIYITKAGSSVYQSLSVTVSSR